jgi:hypothetical protein
MQTIETLLESCTVCGGESDGKMCPECHRPVCVDCWDVDKGMCVLCVTVDVCPKCGDWDDIVETFGGVYHCACGEEFRL